MRTIMTIRSTLALCMLFSGSALAGGRTFQEHQGAFDFLFGNRFDTHQETRLFDYGNLAGFFYITYVEGEFDQKSGLPIAVHCDADTPPNDCFPGWLIRAVPCIPEYNNCAAAFMYHFRDHPYWLIGDSSTLDANADGFVDPEAVFDGAVKGMRSKLPQPFPISHFHWLTEGLDTDPEQEGLEFPSSLQAVEAVLGVDIHVPEQCNVPVAGQLALPGVICPGYILGLRAVASFAFRHGRNTLNDAPELIPVTPGIDIATHHNILSSYAPVTISTDGSDTGGGGDGMHGGHTP